MNLTTEEIAVLIEALEAWEHKHLFGEMLAALVGGMVARTEEQREQVKIDINTRAEKNDRERQVRHERAVLIQAKLIQMRDKIHIDEVTK